MRKIKIENRGKIDNEELLSKTESFIEKIFYEVNDGKFLKFNPKLINVLRKDELLENEELGFRVTLLFDIFKGKVTINKIVNEEKLNITFYKRYPTKGKFEYLFHKKIENVPYEELFNNFKFIIDGENLSLQKGGIYLLKNGICCIVKKFYSNDRIGVIYDEDSEEVEEYITIEDIEKRLR